jgi:hypothetical protein
MLGKARRFPLLSSSDISVFLRDQMGHSSIQITVDTYGHVISGADTNWVDGLDRKTTQQKNATPAQLETEDDSIPDFLPAQTS